MNITEGEWPWLCWLAQGYFGEDWPDEYHSAAAVVDALLAEASELGPAIAAEIHQILQRYSEADLATLFEQVDLLVDPGVDLNTYRGWLAGVALRVTDTEQAHETTTNKHALESMSFGFTIEGSPSLATLGSRYFRSGWEADAYWSTQLVVERFMAERPDLAAQLPAEISAVLDTYDDEEELGGVIRALGINYDPTQALNTNRGWLTQVARRVQQPLEGQA